MGEDIPKIYGRLLRSQNIMLTQMRHFLFGGKCVKGLVVSDEGRKFNFIYDCDVSFLSILISYDDE